MAFVFGDKSLAELQGVHPHLVNWVNRVLELSPVDFMIYDGLRQASEQAELIKAKATSTTNSRHLKSPVDGFGHAVDLVPVIGGKPRWVWEPIYKIAAAAHKATTELGLPIRWGAVWDRNLLDLDPKKMTAEVAAYGDRRRAAGFKKVFTDGPHFELVRSKTYPQ